MAKMEMAIKNEPQRFTGKDSVDLYKFIFDNILDGLAYCQMVFDEQGNPVDWIYIQVNKNFEKLTGLKNAEGKKVTELIPGIKTSNPELFETYGRVSLGGKPEKLKTYVEPLARWFVVSVFRPQKGFFVAIFQNITDEKQKDKDLNDAKAAAINVLEDLRAEKEALADARAKDEALLSSIGDGIIATDSDRKIILMNKVAEKLLGWEIDEAIGKLYDDIVLLEDEKGTFVLPENKPLQRAFTQGTTTTTTTTVLYLLSKNKVKFPVAITVSPIILDNKIIGAVEVFRDITKEKEIERSKGEFISIASHQLRTPVSALNWLTEALQFNSQNLNPKQQIYVRDLSAQAKRLIELIEDLLDFSRIELKTALQEKHQIDISSFINKFVKEMEPYAASKKHTIILNVKIAGPLTIEINEKSLYNMFQNLVSNAIDYSPENTEVTVNLEKGDGFIKASVSNKGPAIPDDEKPRIFERFYRGESVRKMKQEGTGLGLYVVKAVAEELGGKVGFESPTVVETLAGKEEGKDTTFWFTIPLKAGTP